MEVASTKRQNVEAVLDYLGGNWTKLISRFVAATFVVVGVLFGGFVYLWQTGKANSDEIIRLKAETASTKVVTERIENLRLEVKSDIKDLRTRMDSGFQDINKTLLERLPPPKKK